MKGLLSILVFGMSMSIFGQVPFNLGYRTFTPPDWVIDTVYIDNTASDGGMGTFEDPYNEVSDITWQEYTMYCFKRGQTFYHPSSIIPAVDHIFITNYGEGEWPELRPDDPDRAIYLTGAYNYIQGISVYPQDTNCRGLSFAYNSIGWADSIEVSHCFRPITAGSCDKMFFTNFLVDSAKHDGSYNAYCDTLVFYNGTIQNVNLDWRYWPDINISGGDCIQVETGGITIVDSCTLDHSSQGGKFALILNNSDTAIVLNSAIKSATTSSAVYNGTSANGWYFNGCDIYNGSYGIWCHSYLEVVNCNFFDNSTAIRDAGYNSKIYNNTFVDNGTCIYIGSNDIDAFNNIFSNNTAGISGNSTYPWLKAYNIIYHNSGSSYKGENYLTSNPLFTNYAGGDYSLQSGSPAIDAGKIIRSNVDDYLGNNRPYNGVYDIGAYEYGASTSSDRTITPDFVSNDLVKVNIMGLTVPETGFQNVNTEHEFYLGNDTVDVSVNNGTYGYYTSGSTNILSGWEDVSRTGIYVSQYSPSAGLVHTFSGLTSNYYKLSVLCNGGTVSTPYSVFNVNGKIDSIQPYNNSTLLVFDSVQPASGIISMAISKKGTDYTGYITGYELSLIDPVFDCSSFGINATVSEDTLSQVLGKIITSAYGGTIPYSYLWNTSDTTATIDSIASGNYSLTVTDDNGCVAYGNYYVGNIVYDLDTTLVDSFIINFTYDVYTPSSAINIVNASQEYTIKDTVTGTFIGSFVNGLLGYYPLSGWNDSIARTTKYSSLNQLIFTIDHLPLTGYIYDVEMMSNRDFSGSRTQYTILNSDTVIVDVFDENNTVAYFNGVSPVNGSLNFKTVGLSTSYNYFNGIKVYMYQVNTPCDTTNLILTADVTNAPNGSIDLSVSGGQIPYSYLWSNGETTQDIDGLYNGTYSVNVTDNNGCIEIGNWTITSSVNNKTVLKIDGLILKDDLGRIITF